MVSLPVLPFFLRMVKGAASGGLMERNTMEKKAISFSLFPRAIHSIDIPSLGPWPRADFPRYRYPLRENERENRSEDDRCLATVEEAIEEGERRGVPVAGIMVEPIQAEGGDHHGSPYFFQV